MGSLRADCMQHRIRHRTMVERADHAAFAIDLEIARQPRNRRTDVGGEDGVLCRQFADHAGDRLRVDVARALIDDGQLVQILAGLDVVGLGTLQETAVRLLRQLGQQRGQCRLDVAQQAERQRTTVAQRFRPHVDLRNFRLFREELAVREVGAQDQQGIAALHRFVAGGKADQTGHADIVGIIIFDMLLAAQRMHDGCAQRVRQLHDVRMRPGSARTTKQRDALGAIQQRRQLVDFRFRRQRSGLARQQPLRHYGF